MTEACRRIDGIVTLASGGRRVISVGGVGRDRVYHGAVGGCCDLASEVLASASASVDV